MPRETCSSANATSSSQYWRGVSPCIMWRASSESLVLTWQTRQNIIGRPKQLYHTLTGCARAQACAGVRASRWSGRGRCFGGEATHRKNWRERHDCGVAEFRVTSRAVRHRVGVFAWTDKRSGSIMDKRFPGKMPSGIVSIYHSQRRRHIETVCYCGRESLLFWPACWRGETIPKLQLLHSAVNICNWLQNIAISL